MDEPKEVKKTEELILEARNFFETYKKQIGENIRAGKSVISLDFEALSSFSHELSTSAAKSGEFSRLSDTRSFRRF